MNEPKVENETPVKTFSREVKALLGLSVLIIISQLAQMGMSFTDTVMAGRHHASSLAGVAIGSSLWIPCFLFLMGLFMAITPIVAQAWGGHQYAKIKINVQQALLLAPLIGVLMMIILQLLALVFDYMQMDEVARAQAHGYVLAVSFGLPALAVFQVLRGLNEGAHFTRPYMLVSLVAVLINIPLNYIFIYGMFGLPELGGAGCGWATALVLWLEAGLMLFITLKNPQLRQIHWHRRWQGFDRTVIKEIMVLGSPIGIALLIESSMFSLIALLLASFGTIVVAGHQVAMSFISILFMVPLSVSIALTVRCGFYVGQNQPELARSVAIIGFILTIATAVMFSATILLFADAISSLFSNNPEVRAVAVSLLFFAAAFQISDALQVVAAGILRGYKDTRYTFKVVLFAYWGVGLPLGYGLALTEFFGRPYGAQGFWFAMIIGLSLAALLLVLRFRSISLRQINAHYENANAAS